MYPFGRTNMIIAFIGYKQRGKSTASKYLQGKYDFKPHNFKDALIEEIKTYFPDFIKKECELYNCTPEELFEKKPGHIRQLMQNFGTELRRKENKNYWINKWWQNSQHESKIVVDDCRFLNEAEEIKIRNGIIIKIIRTGQVNIDKHESETEMNDIIPDYTIEVGTGEHDKLYEQLDKIIDKLATKQ